MGTLSLKPKKKVEIIVKDHVASNGNIVKYGETDDQSHILNIAKSIVSHIDEPTKSFYIKNSPPAITKKLIKELRIIGIKNILEVIDHNSPAYNTKIFFFGYDDKERVAIFQLYSKLLNDFKEAKKNGGKGKKPFNHNNQKFDKSKKPFQKRQVEGQGIVGNTNSQPSTAIE